MSPLELSFDSVARPENIRTLFQPLVSIKNKRIIAVEALSRGYLPDRDITLPPSVLFNLPTTPLEQLQLDRLCREVAMNRFSPLYSTRRDLLLSVNLDMSLIDRETLGSGKFALAAQAAGLEPQNVIIEIIESSIQDVEVLKEFINRHRAMGFLIALDDIGAGHSNLDRIPQIKPDVIKIDRGLIQNIHQEYHKFEIARALTRLGRSLGAMIVAEGVEQEEEVLQLMELGVDIFQGFYFARPGHMEKSLPAAPRKISSCAKKFRQRAIETISRRKAVHAAYDKALEQVLEPLSESIPRRFDALLAQSLDSHGDIECIYILNAQGRQISSTMCNPEVIPEQRRFIYQPAPKGTDHSLKEYYLPIQAGLARYTTDPYLSLASGNLCLTISAPFKDKKGHDFVLCMDIGLHGQLGYAPAPPMSPGPTAKATTETTLPIRGCVCIGAE
ncbi:EAL domain-containing protein [Desulfovibrio ferrophilus]|uniref:Diguanylate phosphodiesterase n=1 Tax=Desulfovibrio ferrophilus TaxID=241368 RepID=A0A2Z6B2R0_9BACT|nr:EAL domain-containing protein [Desulfovibrio ferrophilus]BBD09728.1 diguanylate phosphodiesterase [Desulfovibrio ferrophilus]